MRAILKLIAIAGVVAVIGLGQRPELLAGGGLGLVAAAVLIRRWDRKVIATAPRETVVVAALEPPLDLVEDLEGMTVPARMSEQDAYELHQRYAPNFDQQAAVQRHIERFGDERYTPEQSLGGFDPERYMQARSYADAFDQQLAQARRTMKYEVPQPRTVVARVPRLARGSEQHMPRPQGLDSEPDGWDPHKPASVTGMRRVK